MKKRKGTVNKIKAKTILHIVKRRGHTEPYDERKAYGSCYFACRNAHLGEQDAEKISNAVCNKVTKTISKKKFVTSDDIFRMMIQELKKYDEDAAFLYETHRDIS